MNNDTEIVQPDWICSASRGGLRCARYGVVGCRLVRPDGMLQHAGTYLPLDSFAGEQIGASERDINQFPGTNDVEGVVFACVYLKRETLNTVGLLDEDYFSTSKTRITVSE